jgi:hypothetical protein
MGFGSVFSRGSRATNVGATREDAEIDARAPRVDANGVFNTKGLRCPEADEECERCAAPLHSGGFTAPVNLTGVEVIACRYRAEMCDALREETKACKRKARAVCGERDTREGAKTKCKREVNKAWKMQCNEQRTAMVSRVKAVKTRFAALQEKMQVARAKRASGGAGDDLTMLEVELTRVKTAIGHAFEEIRDNSGGVEVGKMSNKMESFVHGPSALDTTTDMHAVLDVMRAVSVELDILETSAKDLCSYEASVSTPEGKVICQAIEEKSRLSEKRINRCAAGLSDYLASVAKIDALIVEKKRRFALLDTLDKFMKSFNGAWSAVDVDMILLADDVAYEPSMRLNLTEHVTTGLIRSMTDHYAVATARRALATAEVDESSLCAHIIPRFQLSLLGFGFTRGELACPPPHGTFIAGRELPDWSPYFLFLLGLLLGGALTIATNHADRAVTFMRDNRSIVSAIAVVILAGRFFES